MTTPSKSLANISLSAIIKRVLAESGWRYAPRYALAFGFMAIVAACTAITAWLMKDIINKVFVERDQTAMMTLPLIIMALFAVRGIATYFQEVTLARIGNRVVSETQVRLFEHVLKMDVGFFKRVPSSDLIQRVTIQANSMRDLLHQISLALGRDVMTLLGLLAVMVAQDLKMSLLVFTFGPLVVIGLQRMSKRIRKAALSSFQSQSDVVGLVRDTAQGIQTVKSYQLESKLRSALAMAADSIRRANNKVSAVQAAIVPLIEIVAGAAIAAVIFYAGWKLSSEGSPPGAFFSFLTALMLAAEPVRRLSRAQGQMTNSAAGVSMMFELLDQPAAEFTNEPDDALIIQSGQIKFDRITFRYGDAGNVLRDVSFIAPAGKTTALVGLSGSGKSTIVNLIQRFWRPNAGSILIDDQDINRVTISSLRQHVALVSQDAFLFQGSIRENIIAGLLEQSDDAIFTAAKRAQIHDFIAKLPLGYDTLVGELGAGFSGGQRQRISIARAFLKDAPIILLDEPTSALDSETEAALQAALVELSRNRTTIVIAHRLSTIMRADQILVLENGSVAESGTHQQLLTHRGAYARLYDLQKLA